MQHIWPVLATLCFAVSWSATGTVWRSFLQREVLDCLSDPSSHWTPIPTGGGLAIIVTLAIGWVVVARSEGRQDLATRVSAEPPYADTDAGLRAVHRFSKEIRSSHEGDSGCEGRGWLTPATQGRSTKLPGQYCRDREHRRRGGPDVYHAPAGARRGSRRQIL